MNSVPLGSASKTLNTGTPAAMPHASFPATVRLRSGKDFERVYAKKCKAADGTLLMFIDRNDKGVTRVGLSVSKKHGGAVVRNRLKRWLREAFRHERMEIPTGLDLIAIPLAADRASLAAYRQSLCGLVRRLIRRLDRSNDATTLPS